MLFEIRPTVGIDGLALGSSKATVRQFFGVEPKVFRRSPNDNPADYWADQGVFAYYDAKGALEALEFGLPAEPTLKGHSLTKMEMERALALLERLAPGVDVRERGTTARSDRLGVSIWCPTVDEQDAKVEAVLIFGHGYFD